MADGSVALARANKLPAIKSQKESSRPNADTILKLWDPTAARKKMTSIESQRIMAVIDEAIKKFEMVAIISNVTMAIDKYSDVMGEHITQSFRSHNNLEIRYNKLAAKSPSLRTLTDKNKLKENQAEFKEVGKLLRHSTRDLIRLLMSNTTIYLDLKSRLNIKTIGAQCFIAAVVELKQLLYERLLTTVEEERSKQNYLSQIIAREQKSSEQVKELQGSLAEAKRERSKEVSKLDETIYRLNDDINEVRTATAETNKRLLRDSKTKDATDAKAYEDQEEQLIKEIAELEKAHAENLKRHREAELAMRKRKGKIEGEVENWISKYDQDMGEKQSELEDLEALYNEEKEQLAELEKRFAELKKEYDTIVEERRLAKEAKEKAEKELALLNQSATVIQALWRGFATRKNIKKKNAKKGGKKSAKSGKKSSKK
eukprot:Colp12_sorted_trinity150504_noHs@28687